MLDNHSRIELYGWKTNKDKFIRMMDEKSDGLALPIALLLVYTSGKALRLADRQRFK
jgi:hypothetical protein